MAKDYDHQKIEKKWQKKWEEEKSFETPDHVPGKENFYALVEFPYPSGDLHIGHWYAYAVPDVFARMKRMQGKNVLFPFGYDAFGLPAENAAIKRNISPADWIAESVTKMGAQMRTMGSSFDWSREVNTSSPEYMRWTQWLFLKFYEKGLAYRGKGNVNWCPVDQTVLANEQVIDGKCERCGSEVVLKELEQWFMKITDYAERLLADLEPLKWPEAIKESQRNWIGKSVGAEMSFELFFEDEKLNENRDANGKRAALSVFTTRPDTIFGATFMVLAPEHLWVTLAIDDAHEVLANKAEVKKYLEKSRKKSERERMANKEKSGVLLKGVWAINPATKEKMPLYVADYVLATYGTGAIMAVPDIDERDGEFAKAIGAPVTQTKLVSFEEGVRLGGGIEKIQYRFRDWLISRQRYWGAPIPVVYDPEGRAHPIPEEHLPWLLPTDADIKPKGTSPLGSSKELLERTERIFGKGWRPETDTMDGFVDNSWYFFRYLDPRNEKEFCSLEKQKAWMPVARYSGGAEHTTVHVLYSRFFAKALYDMGLGAEKEPYLERMNRGIILAEDGRKMSKRWANTVNPDEQVANVGADAVRTYLAFIGPYNEVGSFPWSTNGLIGVRRFLERVAGLSEKVNGDFDSSTEQICHETIRKVSEGIEVMKFNTSVSQLMIFSNHLLKKDSVFKADYEVLLKLLAPFAPHLTEELWQHLGHATSIHAEPWPAFDPTKLEKDEAVIAVQIAGKVKGTVLSGRTATEENVVELVRKDPKLRGLVPENPSRVVFVPGRIINFIP